MDEVGCWYPRSGSGCNVTVYWRLGMVQKRNARFVQNVKSLLE